MIRKIINMKMIIKLKNINILKIRINQMYMQVKNKHHLEAFIMIKKNIKMKNIIFKFFNLKLNN
jgi:hypothetical protein